MAKTLIGALCALLLLTCAQLAAAQEASRQEMRGLDEQVQEIKSDVLSIAAELNGLEEKLLYPSDTQLAVFVAVPEGSSFRLDAVQVTLDGRLATHYIYSFKELEALQKGGVQRIYTGNVATGAHALEVRMTGKTESGRDYEESGSFTFDKGVNPKLLGLVLSSPDSAGPAIELGDW